MIENILVFSFSFIGDVVLSTAVVRPLRRHFPTAKIAFLVGPRAFELLSGDPEIDEVLVYDNGGEHAGWRGKWHLVRSLRRKRFDLVINIRDSIWSRFVGGRQWGRRFGGDMHAVTRYLDVLQRHGVDTVDGKPCLQFTTRELAIRDEFLEANSIDRAQPIIGIHPGGNWRYKLWAPENFAQIADELSQKYNAQILLFAGPDERELQTRVRNLMDSEPTVVESDDLRQVSTLIEACDCYIGNDTGPMHIAAAVETPVIAVFGATSHVRSGPYGDEHIVVESGLVLGCNPCHPGRNPGGCGAESCAVIDAVTVDQVFHAVEKRIQT